MKREANLKKPFMIRLPGFLVENETGLGDIIRQATSSFGIKACNSCEERARMLNGWVRFGKRSKT